MKTGLRVMPLKGVSKDVADVVRSICKQLSTAIEFRDRVDVVIAPAPVVGDKDAAGFGAFVVDNAGPSIWIAGEPPIAKFRNDFLLSLTGTLTHEVVHYEQWRDGRKATERGVAVRARNLLKKARGA